MGLREEQKKQRHEKILSSFGRMLKRKSYSDITMQQLAIAARVSVGTLYNYFKDKDALVMAYVEAGIEPFIVRAEEIASNPPEDPREAFLSLLSCYLESFATLPKALVSTAIQISMSRELASMPSGGYHRHAIDHILKLMGTLRKRGSMSTRVNMEASALVLFSIITDLVFQYSLRPDVDMPSVQTRLRSCFDVIYEGLDPRAGATGSGVSH